MIEYYLLIMMILMLLWSVYFVLLSFTAIFIDSDMDNMDLILIILLVSYGFIFLYPIVIYNAIIGAITFSICFSLIKLINLIKALDFNINIDRTYSYRENAK